MHLALGIIEPLEIAMGPLLEFVQVPVNGILPFRFVNHTTQLGVIYKFVEGALNLTGCVFDGDSKQY